VAGARDHRRNGAGVRFDKVPRQIEPQPEAGFQIEDHVDLRRCNAGPEVAHDDDSLRTLVLCVNV
jgi:hypothetical protein